MVFLQAVAKPFYINLWFHISHAPMRPTPQQYQALADWEAPTKGNCGASLLSKCPFPFESVDACLACTRMYNEQQCNPKQVRYHTVGLVSLSFK